MIYIDSNIFIYAFTNINVIGTKASALLDALVRGQINAVTSYITFDEVFWKLSKKFPREKALEYTKNFLQTPHLTFVPVDNEVVLKSYELLRQYKIDPRDAIHAATAIITGAVVISEDNDFSQIKEIKNGSLCG